MLKQLLNITIRTSLAVFFITLSASVVKAKATDPSPAIARVTAITVDGKVKPEAKSDEVVVKRASPSSSDEPVKSGMELFANDELRTFEKTSVSILFLNTQPDKSNEIILAPKSWITISSVTCNFACRWLARLKDVFDGKNRSVQLDNGGTEYEFTTLEDGASRLIVYDGVVNITKIPGGAKPGSAATNTDTPRIVLAGYVADAIHVRSLQHVNIGSDGHIAAVKDLGEDELKRALTWSNAAIIAMHPGDPTKGSEGISKVSQFKNASDRDHAFTEARFQSLWNQDPKSLITLGQVYGDWGEGAKAVDLYDKAEGLFRKGNPAWEPSAELLLAKAEANRLIGKYEVAASLATTALEKDSRVTEIGNLVLGNIKYSQAISVRNAGNPAAARLLLAEAANAYSTTYDLHQGTEQIATTNLVVAFQALGNINGEKNDNRSIWLARSRYKTAAKWFEDSLEPSPETNPANPLARTARADIFVVKGNLMSSRMSPGSSAKLFGSAESYYRAVLRDNPEFAPAYRGLGNLYEVKGQSDEALKYYEQWASYNPKGKTGVAYVPLVTGKSKLAALQILTSAGLIPVLTGQGDWVAAQSLPVGTKVSVGEKVSLTLISAKPISPGSRR